MSRSFFTGKNRLFGQLFFIMTLCFLLIGCNDPQPKIIDFVKRNIGVENPSFRNLSFVETDHTVGYVCGEMKFDDPSGTYLDYTRFTMDIRLYGNDNRIIGSSFLVYPDNSNSECSDQCKQHLDIRWNKLCGKKQ